MSAPPFAADFAAGQARASPITPRPPFVGESACDLAACVERYPGRPYPAVAGNMFRIAAIRQPPDSRFSVMAVHISRSFPPARAFWT
jgi:hypothetical protein